MLNTEKFELRKKKIQEEQVLNLFDCGGFRFTETWFPYTSGQVGNYYVQSIDICRNGDMYALAIEHMIEVIRHEVGIDNFDIISGGESRDWDFSNPIAVALHKPHTKLYKDGKMIGAPVEGKIVLHIADLNNEGSSPRDFWVPAIRKAGGIIEHVVFYVDRMEDGIREMRNIGLASHAVLPLDTMAWDILCSHQHISPEIHFSLMERWKDKTKWAHKALLTYPEQLMIMSMGDNVSQAKALKILDKGYPEIKSALLTRIEKLRNQ
jgi:orotate phosphoribosyltransferase